MKRLIIIILFITIPVYAEIGKGIDDFKEDEFIQRAEFQPENVLPLKKRKRKIYFFKDKIASRYTIGLTAERDGAKIISQSLTFVDAPSRLVAEVDVSVMTDFIKEAIGDKETREKVNEELTDMLKKLSRKPVHKQIVTEKIKRYKVTIAHHETGDWELVVKK
jgi:uncharacterized membrane-anchored protein YjiN (DUF445 family)